MDAIGKCYRSCKVLMACSKAFETVSADAEQMKNRILSVRIHAWKMLLELCHRGHEEAVYG